MGANTVNVHHATAINPFINYPFLRPDAMKAYVDSAHARGIRVKIYYTVRELTNHAPEIPALRSLGNEVHRARPGRRGVVAAGAPRHQLHRRLVRAGHPGRGGGEHRRSPAGTTSTSRVSTGWWTTSASTASTSTTSRSTGASWCGSGRRSTRGRPAPLIDLHSANQYNPRDGFASSANLYLEHFPFIDRLWFGEYFDYNASPDYWLVEMSGIPFGLMGEMLEGGGNPWRGHGLRDDEPASLVGGSRGNCGSSGTPIRFRTPG